MGHFIIPLQLAVNAVSGSLRVQPPHLAINTAAKQTALRACVFGEELRVRGGGVVKMVGEGGVAGAAGKMIVVVWRLGPATGVARLVDLRRLRRPSESCVSK